LPPAVRVLAAVLLARKNCDPELWDELSDGMKFFVITATDEDVAALVDDVVTEVADHVRAQEDTS
jgi:hypothetical protein